MSEDPYAPIPGPAVDAIGLLEISPYPTGKRLQAVTIQTENEHYILDYRATERWWKYAYRHVRVRATSYFNSPEVQSVDGPHLTDIALCMPDGSQPPEVDALPFPPRVTSRRAWDEIPGTYATLVGILNGDQLQIDDGRITIRPFLRFDRSLSGAVTLLGSRGEDYLFHTARGRLGHD